MDNARQTFLLTTATAIISAALNSPFDAKKQLNRVAEAPSINDQRALIGE